VTRVVLHIDRLVLHGVPATGRAAWLRQFEAELTAALAQPGVAQAWAAAGTPARVRHTLPATAAATGGAHDPAAAARALAQAPRGGTR
jgi:hypothetical protein